MTAGLGEVARHDALIGVDDERPPAARQVQGLVAVEGEVIAPRRLDNMCAEPACDGDGVVAGAGVHDDDLVRQPSEGLEAVLDPRRLVLDDEARTDEGPIWRSVEHEAHGRPWRDGLSTTI